MAVIPLKQTVKIIREEDAYEWGNGKDSQEFIMKCRVDEGGKLVRRTSASQGGVASVSTEQVVTSATITFNKLADVRLTDEIHFTDELGVTRIYMPIDINIIRGANGKPLLTEVNV